MHYMKSICVIEHCMENNARAGAGNGLYQNCRNRYCRAGKWWIRYFSISL